MKHCSMVSLHYQSGASASISIPSCCAVQPAPHTPTATMGAALPHFPCHDSLLPQPKINLLYVAFFSGMLLTLAIKTAADSGPEVSLVSQKDNNHNTTNKKRSEMAAQLEGVDEHREIHRHRTGEHLGFKNAETTFTSSWDSSQPGH